MTHEATLAARGADDESEHHRSPPWSYQDRPRVLVVEPRAALRTQIGLALEDAAMTADFAASVDEARRLLSTSAYAAAVIDPAMESGLGLALCRELSRGARVPVVVLHEHGGASHWLRARLAGARAFLVRPLPVERFVDCVRNAAGASLAPTLMPRIT